MGAKEVELREVSKRFGDVLAVRPLSLHVEAGEFLTLLGPSGCGKTTLLRMISGLEGVTTGVILVGGADVTDLPPHRRDTSIMFQDYALFPHKSLIDNISYGLKMRKAERAERTRAAEEWLRRIGLADMGSRLPHQLSGGQRQRVALARALIINPGVLLLDEPLGALDANLRRHMQGELKRLHREVGLSFIYVTHDQEEAITMSDRIAVMRDGTIEQLGAPKNIYDHPETEFVARFIGHCNVIHASVATSTKEWTTCDAGGLGLVKAGSSTQLAPGAPLSLALRPETIEILPKLEDMSQVNRTKVTVTDVDFTGSMYMVRARAADGQVLGIQMNRREAPSRLPQSGNEIAIGWAEDTLTLLKRSDNHDTTSDV